MPRARSSIACRYVSRVTKSISAKRGSPRRMLSTGLTLSKNSAQSSADINRILVMMLRTVTLGPLLLMLGVNHVVGGLTLRGQSFVDPSQPGHTFGVLIAEPLGELNNKRRFQRPVLPIDVSLPKSLRPCPGTQRAVGKFVGFLPRSAAVNDARCQPAKVFDQGDSQRDRHRPQFADRERFHALVGLHKAAQRLGVESTIGMSNQCPGHSKDPWIILKVADASLGSSL